MRQSQISDRLGKRQRANLDSGTISSRDLPPGYLILVRLCGWLALLPRSDNDKNTEIQARPDRVIEPHSVGQRAPQRAAADHNAPGDPPARHPRVHASLLTHHDDGRGWGQIRRELRPATSAGWGQIRREQGGQFGFSPDADIGCAGPLRRPDPWLRETFAWSAVRLGVPIFMPSWRHPQGYPVNRKSPSPAIRKVSSGPPGWLASTTSWTATAVKR